jgi:hypothetical protein
MQQNNASTMKKLHTKNSLTQKHHGAKIDTTGRQI